MLSTGQRRLFRAGPLTDGDFTILNASLTVANHCVLDSRARWQQLPSIHRQRLQIFTTITKKPTDRISPLEAPTRDCSTHVPSACLSLRPVAQDESIRNPRIQPASHTSPCAQQSMRRVSRRVSFPAGATQVSEPVRRERGEL